MRIALLEDDAILSDIIVDYLQERYETEYFFDSAAFLKRLESASFDLYVLDINVPGRSGLELLRDVRAFNDATPAIVITAYEDVRHLKKSFDSGADDFIRKPFELEELGVRIEHLRRSRRLEGDWLVIDAQTRFDPDAHLIMRAGDKTLLSAKESALLAYLMRNAGRVISSEELLHNLWAYDDMPGETAIRTHIKKLRFLIGKARIANIRAKGYRFE